MANYITAVEFTSITGVTVEQCGETGAGTTVRDAEITKAQLKVLKDLDITSCDGNETDYSLIQAAIAFLTAHRMSIRNSPLSLTSDLVSPFKLEYRDIIRSLKTTELNKEDPVFPADGGFDVVTIDDID